MVRSLILALQGLVDARFGQDETGDTGGTRTPVDPSLMPLDLTAVSRPRFAVVPESADVDFVLRRAA